MLLQTRVAFCVRDHSTTKALAGGLDLPDCSWLCERDRSDKGKQFQDMSCKHTNGLRDKNQPPRNCTEQLGDNSERER